MRRQNCSQKRHHTSPCGRIKYYKTDDFCWTSALAHQETSGITCSSIRKIIDHFLPMYIFPRLVIANKVVVVVSTNKQIENGGEGGGGFKKEVLKHI